jgi:Mitochondrial K+-H+ exchange-related
MDVFLVPVAEDRYELYCEEPDEPEQPAETPPTGFVRRMSHRFREMLAEAERDRRRDPGDPAASPQGMLARIKARTLRWVAESIAEQRLLWQLRRRTDACLMYPHDLREAHALEILRRQLGRDFERHRFWLAIDSVGLIASAVLMLLPGPNIVAYYFAFRMVGHYLSVRGARQGLTRLTWRTEASAPLSCLRAIVTIPPEARAEEVHRIASTLRLEHLASFFQRAAVS